MTGLAQSPAGDGGQEDLIKAVWTSPFLKTGPNLPYQQALNQCFDGYYRHLCQKRWLLSSPEQAQQAWAVELAGSATTDLTWSSCGVLSWGEGVRLGAEAPAEHHDEKQTVALHRQGARQPEPPSDELGQVGKNMRVKAARTR